MDLCDQCVGEPALKAFVQDNAEAERCDYCGREEDEAIACSLDDFTRALQDGFDVDWDDALGFMPNDGDDWAIPDAVSDIWDVLDGYDLELNDDLLRDVIAHFQDVAFAPRYFFGYSPDERLGYGWDAFVEHVSHRSRYLFLTIGAQDDAGPEEIPVPEMLQELGAAVREAELVRPLGEGTMLYRARAHGRGEAFSTAAELGAPPAKYATVSSRMSPHGISMFYAAYDRGTALKEASMGGRTIVWHLTLGSFEAGPEFQILDLVNLPAIPSVFDAERRHLIGALRFLHVFAQEVSKPIRRDQLEHVEYVPTQIVAEYFRHLYGQQTGQRVDGVAYRSAVRGDGSNVALFIGNEDCVDAFESPPANERKVRLVSSQELRCEFRSLSR